MLFEREGARPMALSSLLPELYGILSAAGTVAAIYFAWRYNPWRMHRQVAAEDVATKLAAQAAKDASHARLVAEETHAALWGTPALVDDAGALVRAAVPGVLAEVRALRTEFPKNGKTARELLDEISDRQVAHQAELHEHSRAADIVHNALWVALLDSHGIPPQYQGPPAAPLRDEML